jgi:hypothetical protein
MTTTRNYQGKDVDMLTACATIIENAIANQDFLASKRSTWQPPYFDNIKTRIDNAFRQFLGIDSAAEQRRATQTVTQIQTQALANLAELKIQIKEDFKADKKRRDEILKELGYTDFYKQAQSKDQEGLIQMLYRYCANLTAELNSEIISKGTDPQTLSRLSSYADQLSSANITQETLKGSRKLVTEEAVREFNAIYDEVISIAKIAHNFFKGDPNRQAEFSYSKVRSKLNAAPRKTKEETQE